VWCAISTQGITVPYFFAGDDGVTLKVNAEPYHHMLKTFFLPEMRHRNWNMARAWFQRDGATAHTARLSTNTPHSPGDFSLSLVTFSGPPIHRTLLQQTFFIGYTKAQVFTHTLPDINSLKNAIRQEIANVTQDTTSRHGKCTWEMTAMT